MSTSPAPDLKALSWDRTAPRAPPRRARVLLALACAALPACTAAARYDVLSFFFDGVPDPSAARPAPAAANEPAHFVYQPPPPDPASQLKMHPPYAERHCSSCHKHQPDRGKREDGFQMRTVEDMSALRVPVEQLCATCHTPKPWRYEHAPALLGNCVRCHHPHASLNDKLLLAKGSKPLCGECHTADTMPTAAAHQARADRDCASCHDPHGADARFLLRPGWDAATAAPQPQTQPAPQQEGPPPQPTQPPATTPQKGGL